MMTWAETAAQKEQISREEAEKWSLRSHQRAIAAIDSGNLAEVFLFPYPKERVNLCSLIRMKQLGGILRLKSLAN